MYQNATVNSEAKWQQRPPNPLDVTASWHATCLTERVGYMWNVPWRSKNITVILILLQVHFYYKLKYSQKYKLEVGTKAMDILTNVLTNDRYVDKLL